MIDYRRLNLNIGRKATNYLRRWIRLLLPGLLIVFTAAQSGAQNFDALSAFIGKRDSIAIADPDGRIVYAKNENSSRIPASILKVFTALVALHYLGPDYRYQTEFYIDNQSNLIIKGYGDPLLVSEVVEEIARSLALKLKAAGKINEGMIPKLDNAFQALGHGVNKVYITHYQSLDDLSNLESLTATRITLFEKNEK